MRKRQSDDEQTIDGTWMSSENEDFRKDNPLLFSSGAFSISWPAKQANNMCKHENMETW